MSNKSGVSSGVISLPQGGGALHGIGEKFAPDLHTGTGNFTVPIALPSGRNGFQPQLSLVYSTGNGNGPFGLGWGLSIPGVSRKTSRGVPVYDDGKDTFILSGAEDLVPVPGAPPSATRYRPRTEGLFARIEHYRDNVTDYWAVRSKDGLVSHYGTPGARGTGVAVVANPADPLRIFSWKLSLTTDPFGNRIEYLYERDAVRTEGPHEWDQLYLSEIRYIDYGDRLSPQFLVTIRFSYEDRPDPFSEYRSGFEIRTIRRGTRIEIVTRPGTEILARTYQLIYLDQRVQNGEISSQRLPVNGTSLLSQIKVIGHDGEHTEELPPLEFGYTGFEPEQRKFLTLQGTDLPARSLANPDLELADLFGNGLPDILEMNGTVRYWRNLGGGRFDLPREMDTAPAGVRLGDPGVQLIDANGDGRIDVMVNTATVSGYYPSRFGAMWDRRSFQSYRVAPSFDLKDPEVRLVDLDGDGVTDAIRSGSRLECFFNDPEQGWNGSRWVERRALEDFPNINFSDPHVKLGDMTGDSLQDIVLIYDGRVEYWPSLGRGDWGKRISMRNSPRFPYGYDPKRILVGDIDGDGLSDLVYVDNTRVTLWINQGGNGWSNPIGIRGTPPVSDMDAVRLADMLGNGVSGVLWSADVSGLARGNMFFLDFTGGTKPYLVDEMDNHMGAVTRVGYAPSSRFYLDDEQRPQTRWKTPLPFPVQVVEHVEVIDAISGGKLTTEYGYHHGYWDGTEREFRGFGRTDQRDTEVFGDFHNTGLHHPERSFEPVALHFFSPPTETRIWFHQGPLGDEFGDWGETDFSNEFWQEAWPANPELPQPQLLHRPQSMTEFLKGLPRRVKRDALRTLRGRILRTELYALDGAEQQDRPYTVTEYLHGIREEVPPAAWDEERERVFCPHTLAQRATQWERGNDPMTQFTFTDDYDEYGQPRLQINVAAPRGRDFRIAGGLGEPYLATQTVTTYAQRDDDHCYIVDRVAQTTTYEILNDGTLPLFKLKDATLAGSALRRVIGQNLTFYDGPAFRGLPFGQIGSFGALVRTENLVLTEDILREAYKSGNIVLAPPEIPLYLVPVETMAWTEEYPQEFRDLMPPLAGYTYRPGGVGSEYERGYFAETQRMRYDFHSNSTGSGYGLVEARRGPLEHDTVITYDSYNLLPTTVTDAAYLTTAATYDYRVMQPRDVIDPNENRKAYTFTPLGLLESTMLMGKASKNEGDTFAAPSTLLAYEFLAFTDPNRRQPICVRTVHRVHHINETDVPQSERDQTIETAEYSDGCGRLLQTRTRAESVTFGDPIFGGALLPANQGDQFGARLDVMGRENVAEDLPNVVASGWQVYDNKGRIVVKYEPYFSTGWGYTPPGQGQRGQGLTMYYDPRGHVVRTVNPDGSEQRVIFGVPNDLTHPNDFTATAWETYTYDANDNAGRTHPNISVDYQHHWNTPASAVVDALGRTVETVKRNRQKLPNGSLPPIEEFRTQYTYDILGNLLTVTDALGRAAFQHIYDLTNKPLRTQSVDSGVQRSVMDAAGNTIEQRNSKDALILHVYDVLHRPTRLWARDGIGQPLSLREHLIYGDSAEAGSSLRVRDVNLLGKLYKHYDEAGLQSFGAYDFKGNVVETVRRVISDAAILSVFASAAENCQVQTFRVNWQPAGEITLETHAERLLDAVTYHTSFTYDALNRLKMMRYPLDVEGDRKELHPRFNSAGALERVALGGTTYVERITYSAKGQRTLIVHGNGVMTRYAYDTQTFRLVRLLTEHCTTPATLTHSPTGTPLQDFAYDFDLAGNITKIQDRTPASGIPNTLSGLDALNRAFAYDAIYRILSATGRECDVPSPAPPWDDGPRCSDLTKARAYEERYRYDSVGNITQLVHQVNSSGFTRLFTLCAGNNRLATVTVGETAYDYIYDSNGSITQEGLSRHFEWDHSDRLRAHCTQIGTAQPSVHAHYLYDTNGQRVKKLVRKQGGDVQVTVYIDGIFEHHRLSHARATQENNTLHVMDDEKRIALIRVGKPLPDDGTKPTKYYITDHLGSIDLVIDEDGFFFSREEYTPYGETSFGSFAKKRFRFAGNERDEESGLYYQGARYYAPSLGRWISCDTAAMLDEVNLYTYSFQNPVRYSDRAGMQPKPTAEEQGAAMSLSGDIAICNASSPSTTWSSSMTMVQQAPEVQREESINTNPLIAWNRDIGRRWGANRGPFGLAISTLPMAKVALKVSPPFLRALSAIDRTGSALILDSMVERANQEMEEAEAHFARERGELYEMPVAIMGTVDKTKGGQFVDAISKAYQKRVAHYESAGSYSPDQIGRFSEADVLQIDAPRLMKKFAMNPNAVRLGNYPVGVTGPKGGQITAEVGSHYYNILVELKKSPAAVRGARAGWQAQAQELAASESINFPRPPKYYRLYGQGQPGRPRPIRPR
jgi:RHS repeat-associated protein